MKEEHAAWVIIVDKAQIKRRRSWTVGLLQPITRTGSTTVPDWNI